MKFDLTEQQLKEHSAAVRRGALEGTVVSGILAGAGTWYAQRRWPAYRQLPTSLKVLAATIIIAPALSIQAERRSLEYEQSQWTGETVHLLSEKEQKEKEKWEAMTLKQKVGDWASRHEYSIIMGSWAASLAAAGAIISRDKLQTPAQKVVQARMWAQGLTIGILIVAGALKHSQRQAAATSKYEDHSWKDVLEQRERERQEDEKVESGSISARRRGVVSLDH
ncbi:Replication factor C, subunit RFC4 [Stygiomarasmius scandens]|uniref:Replication factor C, subunit RFC4 n=1 Tax=Marasmiellus scandens TaxID=2682957 RepID=A0ABR1K3S9_9AGAR